jgi:hypothetical protein
MASHGGGKLTTSVVGLASDLDGNYNYMEATAGGSPLRQVSPQGRVQCEDHTPYYKVQAQLLALAILQSFHCCCPWRLQTTEGGLAVCRLKTEATEAPRCGDSDSEGPWAKF